MKNLFLLAAIVGGLAWYANHKERITLEPFGKLAGSKSDSFASSGFTCAGKTHCSQMSSCEEARFYLSNCPGTEMDGDGDGIPCETQWCGH